MCKLCFTLLMGKEEKLTAKRWTAQAIRETDPGRKMFFFSLALELDPFDAVALNQKGMLHHKKGDFEEAIRCYDRILCTEDTTCAEIDADATNKVRSRAAVLFNKSLALQALGNNEGALNFMKKALSFDPDNARAKEQYEKLLKTMAEGKTCSTISTYAGLADISVNELYNEWRPPGVMTLLSYALRSSPSDINYHKGFGEDLIKEKAIKDKLDRHVYCCGVCINQHNGVCGHKRSKGRAVSLNAICGHFKPKKGI